MGLTNVRITLTQKARQRKKEIPAIDPEEDVLSKLVEKRAKREEETTESPPEGGGSVETPFPLPT